MRACFGYLTRMHPGGDTELSRILRKYRSASQEPHFVFCQSEGARSPTVKSPSPSAESGGLAQLHGQWGRGAGKRSHHVLKRRELHL